MRNHPHLATITSAGFNKNSPCYELRMSTIDILNKVKKDEQHFGCIFEMDENDDWRLENNWYKANPNLGITVQRSWLKNQVEKAINNPSDEAGVRVKNLNQWLNVSNTWIQDARLLECFDDEKNVLDMFDKAALYYCAVDLSSTSDLTCCSILCEVKNKLYAHTAYFLPEDSVETNRLKTKIQEWHRNGEIILTPGNCCDYDYVLNYIKNFDKKVKARLRNIYLDRWNATQFQISLVENSLPVEPFSQSIASFSAPTKYLEKLVLEKNIILSKSSLTLFCFRNVTLKMDHNGNIKPQKDMSMKKIDSVITLIMCVAASSSELKYSNSIG
jgi:phage terminase large subunit-like protein